MLGVMLIGEGLGVVRSLVIMFFREVGGATVPDVDDVTGAHGGASFQC
jgi:hypothetical protein